MRIRVLLVLIAMYELNGCTLIPGQHMSPFSDKSSIEMPVKEQNQTILKKLAIKPITARLIIDFRTRY